MKRYTRMLVAVTGFLALFGVVTILNPLVDSVEAKYKRHKKPDEVKVVNGMDMPIPVVVKEGEQEERVLLREGYTVPDGKRLFIDDMSVQCKIISKSPADFDATGVKASAQLRIFYPPDKCPEPLVPGPDSPVCQSQDHVVGTAETVTSSFSIDGSPVGDAAAGRRMAVFADAGGTLVGLCGGSGDDIASKSISIGTGRLVDFP